MDNDRQFPVGKPFEQQSDETVEEVVSANCKHGHVQVLRVVEQVGLVRNPKYWVLANSIVKHPGCDAEAAMRALGTYLHQEETSTRKYCCSPEDCTEFCYRR